MGKFTAMLRQCLKVVKEGVITDEVSIHDSNVLRRMEMHERCEVIDGPVLEKKTGCIRFKIRLMRDALEGWVTPLGDQGTVFLQQDAMIMKVVKETVLTTTFEIGGTKTKTKRKLKEGEIVEVREPMKKEEESGLMRAKIKTRSDNLIGWATAVGNAGNVLME